MRIGQTVVINFTTKIAASVLGFVATVYLARTLGDTVLGQFSLIMALVTWFGILKSLGISTSMVKRISEGEEPDQYFAAGTLSMFTITVLSLAIIFFAQEQINNYVGFDAVWFVALVLMVHVSWTVVKSALKGSHLVHVYSVANMGGEFIKSLSQIGLVFVGFGLAGMVYGHAIGVAVAGVMGFWFLKPSLAVPRKRHFVSLFDYAKYAWVGGMQSKTHSWVDVTVMGFFVQTGLIGVYSVAWSITTFVNTFGSSVSSTLFPEISSESTQNNLEYTKKLIEESLSYAGLFMIPGLVGGVLLGDRLLQIYGSEFVVGETVLSILLVTALLYAYLKQLLNALNALDRPDLAAQINTIYIFINVVLNIVLIYLVGWVGAAIATAVTSLISLGVAFVILRREVLFSIPIDDIGHQFIAAFCMGVVVYVCRWLNSTYGLVSENTAIVLVLVALGAITYFVILYGISSTFRVTVQNNFDGL